MTTWWVSQGKNYPTAIAQGSLWTLPHRNGVVPPDRAAILAMAQGDVTIHYYGPAVRAVSFVDAVAAPTPRPPGYPAKPGEGDSGWLVRVVPVRTGLSLHRDVVASLIQHGSPGPLDVHGSPAQKYISPLSDADASALLAALEVDLAELDTGPSHDVGQVTDAQALVTVRLEQGTLRRYLLGGRVVAPCAVCGRLLPSGMLVAAHIKPRYLCTDAERLDLAASAMLACTLGCDALFELGLVVVDEHGFVRAGAEAPTAAVADAVAAVEGLPCTAHGPSTAARFTTHRSIHVVLA